MMITFGKRLGLLAFDFVAALVCAALLVPALTTPAYAYVDPSVMTYTIQALAGVAVALSALAGVAFRRTRKAIMKSLNIDENARKTVEEPVYRLNAEGEPICPDGENAQLAEGAPSAKRKKNRTVKRLKWPSRFWRALLASVFLVGTVFLVAPAEMVAANSGSLVFSISDIWQPVLINAGVVALGLALIMSIFWGRGFDFIFMLVVALGVCCYVQALFLNQGLPSADGSMLDLAAHRKMTVISCAVWIAAIITVIVLTFTWSNIGRGLGVFVSLALVIVQGAAVASIWVSPESTIAAPLEQTTEIKETEEEPIITQEGLYEVSPKDNVVVFVLDAFDVINMNRLLVSDPGVLDEMTGFTYFRNSSGSSVPTRYGMAYLLTGVWPSVDQTWEEYIENRYAKSTFLDDVLKQDYSLYVYTDLPGYGGTQYLSSRATNVHPANETLVHTESSFNLEGALRSVYKMALYRDMPWIIKEPFWFYTDGVNRSATNTEIHEEELVGDGRPGSNLQYALDDAMFYERLADKGLSVYDDGAKGSLHLIHLFGAHIPYTLDEDGTRREDGQSDDRRQCKGALRMVSEYLHQMKELGVYDDATIIVTADHGYWFWDDTIEQSEADGDMAGGPIMLVKPAGSAEQSSQPFKISDTRTGHPDFQATVIKAMGGDSKKYGETVFDEHDPNRIRYYYWPTHDGTLDLKIYEYAIDGEVTNFNNWRRTGVTWDFGMPTNKLLI